LPLAAHDPGGIELLEIDLPAFREGKGGPDDRATSTRAPRGLVPAVTVTCESWVEVYAWVVA